MPLLPAERDELLGRARRSGATALGLAAGAAYPPPSGRLAEPGACFVTWKRDGKLRGCIGTVEPQRPLALDVESNAVSALLHDPRFAPCTPRDFPRYRCEISVLFPRETISSAAEVEVGRHGLYVARGSRRGLLLPQVAPEWGWTAERFLEQVCLKAGLPGTAWTEPGTSLYRFEAEVFGAAAPSPLPSPDAPPSSITP